MNIFIIPKKIILIIITIILLSSFILSIENPCINLSEEDCQTSYIRGFYTYDDCKTSYYCFPIYKVDKYDQCKFYPRTNLANCKVSPTTCYNNIPVNTSYYRRCFCGKGVEFRKINACGEPIDWTGECILPKTCNREIKLFHGKEYEYFVNCKTPESQEKIICNNLSETQCDDNETLIHYLKIYNPNECNTTCELINTTITKTEKCICKNNQCIGELLEANKEHDPVSYKRDKENDFINIFNIRKNYDQNITNAQTQTNFTNNLKKNLSKQNIIKIVLMIIGAIISFIFITLIQINKNKM